MEPQEIDSALDELENRLDRLRSLYEQYFMGIEKIEPTVPRKDVDRRFWILRRTPIRNTARRFRLQTLVQRYNTFQQHWTRICREIENGTYVRHLLKAQKTFGAEPKTWAAKKRLGLLKRERAGTESAPQPASAAPPAAATEADVEAARPAARGVSEPKMAPATAATESSTLSALPAQPRPRTSPPGDLQPLHLDLDDAPTLPPARAPAARGATATAAARPPVPPRSNPAIGGAQPGAPRAPAPGATQRPSGAPISAIPRPNKGSRPPLPRPATPAAALKPKLVPSVAAAAPRADVPAPSGPNPAAALSARSASTTTAGPATPKDNAVRVPRPGTQVAPPGAAVARPKPASPGQARAATAQAAGSAPDASPRPASGVSDERVAQLHAELNAARRQLNQSSSVSMDSLAKSLRDTESKLRAQHGGRKVDFQVVIKDGKPIVKPVLRR